MEFILINESKLKIMISKSELEEFDICTDELDYSNSETKRIFWDIIHRAKKSVGFVCDNAKVLVQLYSSRDGGCEMFVSKLKCYDAADFGKELLSVKYVPYDKSDEKTAPEVFGFDSLEWLLSVCRRLSTMDVSDKSSVYLGDDGRFYLILERYIKSFEELDEYSFISEYGSFENVEAILRYIGEHGKPICEKNAVETLSSL